MEPKKTDFVDPYNPTPEELKAYYERARREFSMDDLRKFEEEADELPFAALIEELTQGLQEDESEESRNEPS